MEVFEAIRTLLAVRAYRDDPIPEETVQRIIEAGRLSGSASNRQPWHFIAVYDRDTLREIAAIAQTGPYIAQAPVAIVVAIDPSIPFAVSDASRAIQDMLLAAWADGVGSNWVGFRGRLDKIKSLLGIPSEFEVLAVLPFGYPVAKLGRGRKQRKALSEVASRERFGRPFV
jgi:nitroreductase